MIYIDELRQFGNGKWCHLAAAVDTDLGELHRMAMLLGLSRRRFNGRSAVPHYPLHESRRGIALQHGVQPLERSEFVRLCARGQQVEEPAP